MLILLCVPLPISSVNSLLCNFSASATFNIPFVYTFLSAGFQLLASRCNNTVVPVNPTNSTFASAALPNNDITPKIVPHGDIVASQFLAQLLYIFGKSAFNRMKRTEQPFALISANSLLNKSLISLILLVA